MKKSIFLLTAIGVIAFVSCQKQSASPVEPTKSISAASVSNQNGVWYGAHECEAQYGCGSECIITSDDETCELQTECVQNSNYTSFNALFEATYDEATRNQMCSENAALTDESLLQALKDDGFEGNIIVPAITH